MKKMIYRRIQTQIYQCKFRIDIDFFKVIRLIIIIKVKKKKMMNQYHHFVHALF